MNKKPIKSNPPVQKQKPKPTNIIAAVPNSSPVQITTCRTFKCTCVAQNFVLICLDEKITPDNADYFYLIDQLKLIASKIELFNDLGTCVEFIRKIEKQKVIFIVSNRLSQKAVVALHPLETIIAILIFCTDESPHESWIKQWNKIQGIFMDANQLIHSLKASVKQIDDEFTSLSFISSDEIVRSDIKHLDPSFMYTTLVKDILLKMDHDKNAFEAFVKFCREKYAGKLKGIDDLEAEYHQKTPIWCYTLDTFFYSMLNQVLRDQDFDGIIRMGFFIKQLHQQIADLHAKQYKTKQQNLYLYRGQGLSEEQLGKVKKGKGGLLSFNNFLSTSTKPNVADRFIQRAFENGHSFCIYFTITVDPSTPSAPFAYVEDITAYKGECEVLFSMLTIFRIDSIEQDTSNERLWKAAITLISVDDEDLHKLTQRIHDEIQGPTPLHRLGALMIWLNQFDTAEEVCKKLMISASTPLEEAQTYYQLGQIKSNQRKSLDAIDLYKKALTIYRKQLGPDHENIGTIYNNIGLVYDELDQYPQALQSYQEALSVYQKKLDNNHLIIGTCYNNIAAAYANMKNYKQALFYYEESYKIYDRQLSNIDPRRAMYYHNIGQVYLSLKRYSEALSSFESAVRIGKQALPSNDPNLQIYKKSLAQSQRRANE